MENLNQRIAEQLPMLANRDIDVSGLVQVEAYTDCGGESGRRKASGSGEEVMCKVSALFDAGQAPLGGCTG